MLSHWLCGRLFFFFFFYCTYASLHILPVCAFKMRKRTNELDDKIWYICFIIVATFTVINFVALKGVLLLRLCLCVCRSNDEKKNIPRDSQSQFQMVEYSNYSAISSRHECPICDNLFSFHIEILTHTHYYSITSNEIRIWSEKNNENDWKQKRWWWLKR